MTLPFSKKQLDHARKTKQSLFQVNFDFRFADSAMFGKIKRNGLLTRESVDKIMTIIDDDVASKSDKQRKALEDIEKAGDPSCGVHVYLEPDGRCTCGEWRKAQRAKNRGSVFAETSVAKKVKKRS